MFLQDRLLPGADPMKDENILRIKFNGRSLIKLIRSAKGRDFLLSTPTIKNKGYFVSNHFTLHTPNSRLTWKITKVKEGDQDALKSMLYLVKDHPVYKKKVTYHADGVTPKDLDMYEGKILDLSNPSEFQFGTTVALNMENTSIDEYFDPAKTKDREFKWLKDIVIPKVFKDKVTIRWFISKNFQGRITEFVKGYKEPIDDYFLIRELNSTGEEYTFLFIIIYGFPELKDKDKKTY